MRRFLIALAVVADLALPAQADLSVDALRTALDHGDFATIEADLAKAHHDAILEKSFSEVARVYSTLFDTANERRFAATQDWLAAYPDSPYAAAALGWTHYSRAMLLRGAEVAANLSPEAASAFRDERQKAEDLADRSLAAAADFGPALDLKIDLIGRRSDKTGLREVVEALLAVAPSRRAIQRAQGALSLKWGGSFAENATLCEELTPRVPDYDPDACFIEFVFWNDLEGPPREKALALLDARDEGYLDWVRLRAYLAEWKDRPEAMEEAERIHFASLNGTLQPDVFRHQRDEIVRLFQDPLYGVEAEEALMQRIRDRLPDTPQNYRLLVLLIDEILDRDGAGMPSGELDLAWDYWTQMLSLGEYQPQTWTMGARLNYFRGDNLDFGQQARFYANVAYYSNNTPRALVYALDGLFNAHLATTGEIRFSRPLAEVAPADILCPMFRAERLLEAACARTPKEANCNRVGAGGDNSDRVRAMMAKAEGCIEERTATGMSLDFTPVAGLMFLNEDEE